eukprot:COSAG01_NODE_8587_length_2728_cov_4.776721_4_plen_76_part_00
MAATRQAGLDRLASIVLVCITINRIWPRQVHSLYVVREDMSSEDIVSEVIPHALSHLWQSAVLCRYLLQYLCICR